MQRLALVLLALAACGDDGTPTAAASLMGEPIAVKSSYSKPFSAADGAGTTVLGWKVVFTAANSGTGCKADGVKAVATISIYTSQTADSSHKVADLATGDFSIVLDTPPTAPANSATANMEADNTSSLEGTVSISGVAKSADGKTITGVMGTVNVGGLDSGGNTLIMTGTFDAPLCN